MDFNLIANDIKNILNFTIDDDLHRDLMEGPGIEYWLAKYKKKFIFRIPWSMVSEYTKLSEDFIEMFQYDVFWDSISRCQKLSEGFIERFQDKVSWRRISMYQKLSEEFIERFQDKVNWDNISEYQKLSEGFIKKFQDKVNWHYILMCQKLSPKFIERFKDKVDWGFIALYQKFSPRFIKKHNIKIDDTINDSNWLYKSNDFKLDYIRTKTNYEVVDDKYIIAYKGIRSDNYSKYNFQYQYEIGKTYECHCDCNIDNENSFGLSAWDIEKAELYCNEKILKVQIAIEDIGCILGYSCKIRCFKLKVLGEVPGVLGR